MKFRCELPERYVKPAAASWLRDFASCHQHRAPRWVGAFISCKQGPGVLVRIGLGAIDEVSKKYEELRRCC